MLQMTYRDKQKQLVAQIRAQHDQLTTGMSIVPIRRSYTSSVEQCLTLVAFLPLDLSNWIVRNFVAPLRRAQSDHHFFAPDALHMTVKNVRKLASPPNFTRRLVDSVNSQFAKRIPAHKRIEMSIEDYLLLDTSISLIGYCDSTLLALIRSLDQGLREIGVYDDKSYASSTIFFGNVTICRFTRFPSAAFLTTIQRLPPWKPAVFTLDALHLISCDAGCDASTRTIYYSYGLAE